MSISLCRHCAAPLGLRLSILPPITLSPATCLSSAYLDSPFCRPGQHRVYGVARQEEARIICDLDANPSAGLHFKWFFNSSAGFTELPTTAWTFEGSRSVARYLPSSDLDFGSLLCSASNSIGQQSLPCVYHVIPAGNATCHTPTAFD